MRKSALIALSVVAVAALLVPAGNAMAQAASAPATATATIVTPIAISNIDGLAFGNVAASTTAGTVTVTPGDVRSALGGVAAIGGLPFGAATFTITGEASRTFTIDIPQTPVTIGNGAGGTMTVTAFTSDLAVAGTASLVGGTATLNVGGTLNVGAGQAVGSYTGTFNVTVAYN